MITDLSAKVNTGKAVFAFKDLSGQLPNSPSFERVLSAVGQRIKSRIQLGFRNSTDPWGKPWAEIEHRDGQPLVDTGRLKNSITYFADSNQVEIGTNVDYAPTHQFGTAAVWTRPFMPLDENGDANLPEIWKKSVLNAINQHIKKAANHAN